MSAPKFERDREKFLSMLCEIRARLDEQGPVISAIGSLVEEIQDLELPTRLGFRISPLVLDTERLRHIRREDEERKAREEKAGIYDAFDPRNSESAQAEEARVLRSYVWNDPCSGGGPGARLADLPTLIDRWIRSVQALQVPTVYPDLPGVVPIGVDERHASDPLWRTLSAVIDALSDGSLETQSWSLGSWPPWVRKLNALASYDLGLRRLMISVMIESSRQVGIAVQDSVNREGRILKFAEGGRLRRSDVKVFCASMRTVQDARAKELDNQTAQLGKSDDNRLRTKTPKKRGPVVKHDSVKDKKLVDDWLASGTDKEEFERRRRLKSGDVVRAQDRLRSATHRARQAP